MKSPIVIAFTVVVCETVVVMTSKAPAAVGEPDSTPVAVSRLSPGGRPVTAGVP